MPDWPDKDLGHFPYQSAHGKGMSWACRITAHILTLHYEVYRLDHGSMELDSLKHCLTVAQSKLRKILSIPADFGSVPLKI